MSWPDTRALRLVLAVKVMFFVRSASAENGQIAKGDLQV